MKAGQVTAEDIRLHALLHEHKIAATLPPHFREGVWRRIARQEEQPSILSTLRNRFTDWINLLPLPTLAVSYMAVLLLVGAGVGWAQARQEQARVSDEMRLRYVQSIDPYQAKR